MWTLHDVSRDKGLPSYNTEDELAMWEMAPWRESGVRMIMILY